ncbi:TetR/AcrR family transcriptional regulator [Larkinella harenae]
MEKSDRILATALSLFVTYGFHGTPTSRIAAEAGVSNGTLFHYFKTKDELVVALYNRIKEEQNTDLSTQLGQANGAQGRLQTLFVESVRWAVKHPDEYYFIQQFHFSPHLNLVSSENRERQDHLHRQLLEESLQQNWLKPLPAELIGTLWNSHITGTYHYILTHKSTESEQQALIQQAFDLVWTMLANPETR